MSTDKGFLERWSRLKREGRAPVASPSSDAAVQEHAKGGDASPVTPPNDEKDAEPFDLGKLPRVEDLTAETDIRGFLDKRVPAAMRNAALRQMWSLDPTIRDFIEVAENQWNWNVPGGAPGYGPLEEGTDIAALLAQATGAVQRAVASTGSTDHEIVTEHVVASSSDVEVVVAEAVEHCAPQEMTGARAREASPGPEGNLSKSLGLNGESGGIEIGAGIAAPQQPSEAASQEEPRLVRRHGGALPD